MSVKNAITQEASLSTGLTAHILDLKECVCYGPHGSDISELELTTCTANYMYCCGEFHQFMFDKW